MVEQSTTFEMMGLGPVAPFAKHWWALALRGLCGVIFGLAAIMWPEITVGSLVLLFAAYLFVDGVFATIAAVVAAIHRQAWLALSGVALLMASRRFHSGRWLVAFAAVISILLGVMLLLTPLQGALVLAMWLGIYALIFGASLLGLAWRLRRVSQVHAAA
jgi:uncharacterized membrane protein HdeD (DUF308 family)